MNIYVSVAHKDVESFNDRCRVFRAAVDGFSVWRTLVRKALCRGQRQVTRGLLFPEAGASCCLCVHVPLQSDVAVQSVRGAAAGAGAVHTGLSGPAAGPEGEPTGPWLTQPLSVFCPGVSSELTRAASRCGNTLQAE